MKLAMVISQTNPEVVFNALSTMKDLYALVREADRVVIF
jgi:sulfur relay (sulfurtransferase) complex TusBCD TusD component (DsrE family)